MHSWILIKDNAADAYSNMAKDEAMLEAVIDEEIQVPLLRFYTWTTPSISIGRFQEIRKDINLEQCEKDQVSVVRRPTGGRAVYHDQELTYAIAFPAQYSLAKKGIQDSYCDISRSFVAGLQELNIPAELEKQQVGNKKYTDEISCFSATIKYEVTLRHQKIIGSAQLRRQGAVLQQGSILLSSSPTAVRYFQNGVNTQKGIQDLLHRKLEFHSLQNALLRGLQKTLDIQFDSESLPERIILRATRARQYKFSTPDWTFSR